MKIYTPEECEKWINYQPYYGSPTKMYMFNPLDENGKKLHIYRELVNLNGKCYVHNQQRIENNINKLVNNYSKIKHIINKLKIYLCPKPSLHIENAATWDGEYIVYWARGTQIPYCMTDYITAHEIGHCIQEYFCPERKNNKIWKEYLTLRNAPRGLCEVYDHYDEDKQKSVYIEKEEFYCLYGTQDQRPKDWHDNPQEWFAEDFRYLFGVDTGEPYWGLEIDPPNEKLKEFMLSF